MYGIIFMLNVHFSTHCKPVKHLLKLHFVKTPIINCHFPPAWSSWSPDLNLWTREIQIVGLSERYCVQSSDFKFSWMKESIEQHILNVAPNALQSVVKHAVSRFQLLAENVYNILNKICACLAKFLSQFGGCFLCDFYVQDN